jgi:hypothetical protein
VRMRSWSVFSWRACCRFDIAEVIIDCCSSAGVRVGEGGCANVQAGARCRRMRIRAVDESGGCGRLDVLIKRSVGFVRQGCRVQACVGSYYMYGLRHGQG